MPQGKAGYGKIYPIAVASSVPLLLCRLIGGSGMDNGLAGTGRSTGFVAEYVSCGVWACWCDSLQSSGSTSNRLYCLLALGAAAFS